MKTLLKAPRAALVAVFVAGMVVASLVGRASAQQPYVGEVITFAGNFCPVGYLSAEGSLLPIADNQTLFTLIGTTYGGDGQSTFALPNLLRSTVLGTGQGAGLPPIALGQTGGTTNTVAVDAATAKSVQVPATQSPFLGLAQCVSLYGVYPTQ